MGSGLATSAAPRNDAAGIWAQAPWREITFFVSAGQVAKIAKKKFRLPGARHLSRRSSAFGAKADGREPGTHRRDTLGIFQRLQAATDF
jgi:hypothetical protein